MYCMVELASSPGHSQILSHSRDKIWEWPGDEAMVELQVATSYCMHIGIVLYIMYCLVEVDLSSSKLLKMCPPASLLPIGRLQRDNYVYTVY